jgi:hypothetical protein
MEDKSQHLNALNDIKQIMERSSRFISLSGWSGIAAGLCALVGATIAYTILQAENPRGYDPYNLEALLKDKLFLLALFTFIAAFILAFLFTYTKSRKSNFSIWGSTARRLMINVSIPMLVGGIFILKLLEIEAYGLIAPGCLIFYGLALVNASKYTLGEVRYLGYAEIILGLINCWMIGYGLYFWAIGFGVLHIIYGAVMLYKYER